MGPWGLVLGEALKALPVFDVQYLHTCSTLDIFTPRSVSNGNLTHLVFISFESPLPKSSDPTPIVNPSCLPVVVTRSSTFGISLPFLLNIFWLHAVTYRCMKNNLTRGAQTPPKSDIHVPRSLCN
ncbi:uncharacterized protein LACBIDRAFT_332270 [Laccaria bicolor S238N-H82]|uniref:Predicted protein n=1 Tax=Laccaria bicolor (strain S238N-H82 / ATCC MYA-4686) TaxID=486041 RepID=B0DS03_LACBS|nr:uncharacterized protein LACBIDRAFT_308284 [Laccaria bicolor S238N-H82]XP_001886779.1 uncharacterized protein LACBIDRAFT_332270 [Laccaria bicolor S238N-H82]EDR02619.1 predicted protein [Laccaria bicolor S238N-H82]EDR02735.1 predicted protein [Laccaria bicolor S238N-H82]|eukprot:XP_001886663.1 predicted protein [Laccaria bicolor S238N-H82]